LVSRLSRPVGPSACPPVRLSAGLPLGALRSPPPPPPPPPPSGHRVHLRLKPELIGPPARSKWGRANGTCRLMGPKAANACSWRSHLDSAPDSICCCERLPACLCSSCGRSEFALGRAEECARPAGQPATINHSGAGGLFQRRLLNLRRCISVAK